ncbi:MAG: type II toxin-antitoxin system VapC family toxin [Planctomycetes bacterium]|nr:type II toxin-antitoxin system VapC family toxin [Planctomycetota bacterium]
MKYVLDSSVALKWVLPEAGAAKAIQLRDEYHNGVHELIAPDIFPIENLHALTKAERQNKINGAWALWQSIMADAPALHAHIPLLDRCVPNRCCRQNRHLRLPVRGAGRAGRMRTIFSANFHSSPI